MCEKKKKQSASRVGGGGGRRRNSQQWQELTTKTKPGNIQNEPKWKHGKEKKKAKLQYTRKMYTLYNDEYIELYSEHVDKV